MGREVRRVPAAWQHPKDSRGQYRALFEGCDIQALVDDWRMGRARWVSGGDPESKKHGCTWEEWAGPCPDPSDYMPNWPDHERTHWQMYETCSEGTPISPVCASPEELAQWLAEHGASAFADMPATYDEWLRTIQRGSAPSAVIIGGVVKPGVSL